jgi:hypothetical protein
VEVNDALERVGLEPLDPWDETTELPEIVG